MDLKNGFQDISKSLKKKWKGVFNKEENVEELAEDTGMEEQKPEGAKSMIKGEHGTIFGLSRPVVVGIVMFFFLVFALAFLYAASDDTKPQTEQTTAKTTDIADPSRLKTGKTDGMTDDYGALARANAARAKNGQDAANADPNNPKGKPQDGNAQQTPPPANMQPAAAVQAQPTTVPAVPRASVVVPQPGGYSQNYALPSGSPGNEDNRKRDDERTAAEQLKEKLKSAIAFAFDGSTKNAAESAPSAENAPSSSASGAAGGVIPTNYQGSSTPTYNEPTERTVMAGTIIPAMLISGINTDAPGPVIAQVMADVYDMHGRILLIPAGSRVLGTMGSTQNGSGNNVTRRIGVTFNTVVLPNGGAWNIGNSIMAMDGVGYSGLRGNLHRHTGSNLMKGIFNSALTALSTAAVDRVTFDASALSSLTQSQAPTATVAPGYSFNLYVTQNIAF